MSDYSAPGVNGKPKSDGVKTVLKGIRKNMRTSFGFAKKPLMVKMSRTEYVLFIFRLSSVIR